MVNATRWYITPIHSLPIVSWVVEDENHFGVRPFSARTFRSVSKLGSTPKSALRSSNSHRGQTPVFNQREQERRRSS
jgi:hypothetical protein